ncbi:MAG: DMT family transporter [Deltaproteobacteria bacterium]|jgi:drug/metabolite transporter (DMT)-like permease|nr:DMT family transporter [Deltaproteobacteria bacterium]MCW9050568.1 DMT family transporter [Deltaproteobacteria bacterium]
MNYSDHTKGLLLTFIAVLILSPDALLVRLIHADVWTLLFWRCLLTAIMMSLFLALRYRQRFFQSFYAIGKTGLFSALTITIGSLLFVNSLKLTTAANTLIILSASPVISSLLSWLILREKIHLRTKLSIFACFGGILIIFSGSLQNGLLLGDLMALGATAMWGSNIVIIRSGKNINMIPANVLGNLCVIPIVLLLGAQPMNVAPADAGVLLLLGGLILPVSFAMITLGPRYLQAPEVSLILLAETILGPIWVWMALGEIPHSRTLIAGMLILGTLIVHTLMSLRQLPNR